MCVLRPIHTVASTLVACLSAVQALCSLTDQALELPLCQHRGDLHQRCARQSCFEELKRIIVVERHELSVLVSPHLSVVLTALSSSSAMDFCTVAIPVVCVGQLLLELLNHLLDIASERPPLERIVMDCFLPADLCVALTFTMPLENVPHQVHAIHILRDALAVVKVFATAVLSRPATESLEYPSRPETVHPAGRRSSRAAHLGDLAQRDHVHIKPQLSTFSGCSRTAVAH